MLTYIKKFRDLSIDDIPLVGGKNASLGEMFSKLSVHGIAVPNGFSTTSTAFWIFLEENNLKQKLHELLQQLDRQRFSNLKEIGSQARALMMNAVIPSDMQDEILEAYHELCGKDFLPVAVRSSATAEDLPQASFAGQHESYLNISGDKELLVAIQKCFASLYTDRAIKYREDNCFAHEKVALAVGIQKMVRADLASSGVIFTLEPESGFRDVIHISGVWGLGENLVQGTITPDEFLVFKPTLIQEKKSILQKKLGDKALTMIYAEPGSASPTINIPTPTGKKDEYVLNDKEIIQLATWSLMIEEHYGKPMDIEWAKDGITNDLYIIQARPETVQSAKNPMMLTEYKLLKKGKLLASGQAVGNKIAVGRARVLSSPKEADRLKENEILVTDLTSPDWDPILKNALAIITNKGGRTSHASIVARELGACSSGLCQRHSND